MNVSTFMVQVGITKDNIVPETLLPGKIRLIGLMNLMCHERLQSINDITKRMRARYSTIGPPMLSCFFCDNDDTMEMIRHDLMLVEFQTRIIGREPSPEIFNKPTEIIQMHGFVVNASKPGP